MHKIESTTDYSKFKLMKGNRPFGARVPRLIRAIKKKNMLAQFPIICQRNGDGRLLIVDGQHRKAAAEALKLPVFYIIAKGITVEDVSDFNNEQKVWNANDYMESCIAQGQEDYAVLKEFMNAYGLPITVSRDILSGVQTGSHGNKQFRSGAFRVRCLANAHKVGQAIWALKRIIPFATDRCFAIAMTQLLRLPSFGLERLLKKLEYQSSRLVKCATTEAYIALIEDIYNYRSRPSEITSLSNGVRRLRAEKVE